MLRLLYIATNLNTSGGVARVLSVKLNYLVEMFSYEIHMINTNGDSNNLFFPFHKKIQIHDLDRKDQRLQGLFGYRTKLNKKIETINPDIIINCDNGLKGSLLPFFLKNRIPLVYENHNSKNAKEPSLKGNLKLKLSFFFFSLGVSRYKWIIVYQHTNKNRNIKNFKVIPNPIGFKTNDTSSSLENKVVIAVGRFSYQKGYDKLIKIWSLVSKKHPDWVLNIYGEGAHDDLIRLSQKLNITTKVQFFKPVKDIKSIYLGASILVNTSRYEPFGLAVTEAMSCGLPVIAFENTLGPKSYIHDKENGFLIQKDNFENYANKLIMLIENKNEMKRISKAAKESMKAYKLTEIMRVWHELFQSI
ncbi:glycosyltransferase [Flavivirga rizhaonensis]|uniref:Glycosyltransferase family 4 protein n=1 Tax=Flavivirga rizhaonensis TaxID=2559571 RepID=A0A4S1DWX8_9FLAO|nr:glycosyltransferase [Flavivirga rizhaonensis]TGV02559.1 glycosyltransferase family 4 protein [Flavivirga rizhaonensis]